MPSKNTPKSRRHYFELPEDISTFDDAQMQAFVKELYPKILEAMRLDPVQPTEEITFEDE